jgi:hypothetical protein
MSSFCTPSTAEYEGNMFDAVGGEEDYDQDSEQEEEEAQEPEEDEDK